MIEEAAYTITCFIGNHVVEPRLIDTGFFICTDTHAIALMQHCLGRAQFVIDDGKLHLLAQLVVYFKGKIDSCSPLRQDDHLAFWGKHIDVVFVEGGAHVSHESA